MSPPFNSQNKNPVYWENLTDDHQKFWAASILEKDGKFILVRKWGRIGTKGQSMENIYDSHYEADAELHKLINDKEYKGYKGKF